MTNRRAALMEALKAVENKRLAGHHYYLHAEGSDATYSGAIDDAEKAIKALIYAPDQPKGEN